MNNAKTKQNSSRGKQNGTKVQTASHSKLSGGRARERAPQSPEMREHIERRPRPSRPFIPPTENPVHAVAFAGNGSVVGGRGGSGHPGDLQESTDQRRPVHYPRNQGGPRGPHKQCRARAPANGSKLVNQALTAALSEAQDRVLASGDVIIDILEENAELKEEIALAQPPTAPGAPPKASSPIPPKDPNAQVSGMGDIQMDSARLDIKYTEGTRYGVYELLIYETVAILLIQFMIICAELVRGISATSMWCHLFFGFVWLIVSAMIWKLQWIRDHRTRHRYRFVRFVKGYSRDNRADSMSQADLKHQAAYSEVRYTQKYWIFAEREKLLTISHELFVQICTGKNLELTATKEVVWQRLSLGARTTQTVNVDRYLSAHDKFIAQDTVLVAFGLWKRLCQRRALLPFPKSPVV